MTEKHIKVEDIRKVILELKANNITPIGIVISEQDFNLMVRGDDYKYMGSDIDHKLGRIQWYVLSIHIHRDETKPPGFLQVIRP